MVQSFLTVNEAFSGERLCFGQEVLEIREDHHLDRLEVGVLGRDPTNFWAPPNVPALEIILETFDFSKVEGFPL